MIDCDQTAKFIKDQVYKMDCHVYCCQEINGVWHVSVVLIEEHFKDEIIGFCVALGKILNQEIYLEFATVSESHRCNEQDEASE